MVAVFSGGWIHWESFTFLAVAESSVCFPDFIFKLQTFWSLFQRQGKR